MAVSQFTDNHVTYLQSPATFLRKPSSLYENAGKLNSANPNPSIFLDTSAILLLTKAGSPHLSLLPQADRKTKTSSSSFKGGTVLATVGVKKKTYGPTF